MVTRAGIIGAGNIAWRYDSGVWSNKRPAVTLASCFDRHAQTQLVSIYEPMVEARNAFVKGYLGSSTVQVHDTLESFFDQQLDLVAIASPSQFHAEHIGICLRESIPKLWIEKPVTLDLNAYEQLLTSYRSLDQKPDICVNYQRRCLPQLSIMQEHLASTQDPHSTTAITINYSRGLHINGVHLLDLLGALTGQQDVPPLDYLRSGDSANPQFGLTLNDYPVTVTGHDLPYHLIELSITDARGRLSLLRGAQDLVWEAAIPNPDFPGFSKLAEPVSIGDIKSQNEASDNATYLMLSALMDKNTPIPSTLETAWFSQALLNKVVEKAKGHS